MKKVMQVLVIVLLLVAIGPATSLANSAGNAPTGIYSIENGKEKFYSKVEFKALSKADKINIVKNEWYIVTGGQVFPINALFLPSNALFSKAIDQTKFEKENTVNLNEIANGNGVIDTEFDVIEID